jgi:muconolactone delta-isomerase
VSQKIALGDKSMKFLIIQWIKSEVPLKKLAVLMPAQFKYLDELESAGKIETYYHLIGKQGRMVIIDVSSDEELSRLISEDPLFFHSEREIYPLTTRETHKKYLKELLKH